MAKHDIWTSIAAFYEPTLEMVELWTWGIPLFVTVIAVMFMLSEKRQGPLTVRSLIGSIFPREQYAHPSSRVDIWNGVLLLAIGFPLIGVMAINGLAIAGNIAAHASHELGVRDPMIHSAWAMVAIQFIVYFLSVDFAGYWVHRWCHTVPFLWNLHKPHHTAETLTPWTLFRQHPIEFLILNAIPAMFGGVVTGLVLYATGTTMHPGTVAAVGIQAYAAFFIVDVFSHVHVPVSYGWLNRIVLAPVMHNLHHSLELRHRDKNNAVLLTVWDWMFGTLYLPEKGETWRWGLNEEEFGEANPHRTVKAFYLEPFTSVWAYLRQAWSRQGEHEPHRDGQQLSSDSPS
ncbi:sterol desaturase family protein [Sphingobium cloacae]|uniref:Fatty acid hydroxylase domain-containing protein n=1 Tax=Sphingobium cloacae TaxID=120107 RepID=A0A1E1F1Q8_9SPHN|nr:sterol desaturase family protein [Sphingobium cloacae]BAV64455.1 hypothetical protein SCLO_1014150 [Sphingobium cloacae]